MTELSVRQWLQRRGKVAVPEGPAPVNPRAPVLNVSDSVADTLSERALYQSHSVFCEWRLRTLAGPGIRGEVQPRPSPPARARRWRIRSELVVGFRSLPPLNAPPFTSGDHPRHAAGPDFLCTRTHGLRTPNRDVPHRHNDHPDRLIERLSWLARLLPAPQSRSAPPRAQRRLYRKPPRRHDDLT